MFRWPFFLIILSTSALSCGETSLQEVQALFRIQPDFYVGTNNGLYVTTDLDTFTRVNITLSSKSEDIRAIWAKNTQTIFVGTRAGLFMSEDSGGTFKIKETGRGYTGSPVNAIHGFDDNIYVATEAGLAVSTNGGESFDNRNRNDGLASGALVSVVTDSSSIYTATKDELFHSADSGESFEKLPTAANDTFDGIEGQIQSISLAANSTIFLATNVALYRSQTDGQTWSLMLEDDVNTFKSIRGKWWLGTNENGILLTKNEFGVTSEKGSENGVGGQTVNCFEADDTHVYIGTNRGLTVSGDNGKTFRNIRKFN